MLVSTNIIRDQDKDIDFIPTANSNAVFERVIYNHERGQNCFTLIGSYGTGKSTFLWAFEQHLQKNFFFNNKQDISNQYQFVKIIGESISFRATFCEHFGLTKYIDASNKVILKNFNFLLEELNDKHIGLVIIVDEFGKHLEFIAQKNPEEMYFIQELCEFINDPLRNVLFITTLHQNINAYAHNLSLAQRSEWEKVQGRMMEIPFDEPIEQLLFFAAQKLGAKRIRNKKDLNPLFDLLAQYRAIQVKNKKQQKQLELLYPLEPFAAELLTKSLQKYGQNERSLFGFLDSDYSAGFIKNNEIFTIENIFDYLIKYHYSAIEDPIRNSNKSIWQATLKINDRLEIEFSSNYNELSAIIKFICITSIFANNACILDRTFIEKYFKTTGKFHNSIELIASLESSNIIVYSRVKNKYTFKEATDLNLEEELVLANNQIDHDFNVVSRLKELVLLPSIFAKRAYYTNGIPRIFNCVFKDKTELLDLNSNYDGELVYLFEELTESELNTIKSSIKPLVIASAKKDNSVKYNLIEVEKLMSIRAKYSDDKPALRIINEDISHRIDLIKAYFEEKSFSLGHFEWYVNGEISNINSITDLNKIISDLCIYWFNDAPIYKNEMVNRNTISTPILTARKQLIKAIIEHGDLIDLGFEPSKFPPEKTIYLSLLKKTGIHRKEGERVCFFEPLDSSFNKLWHQSRKLIEDSTNRKTSVQDLYDVLKEKPFGLKKGFLDFWIPIFMIIQKEEYSLYYEDGEYIPQITPEVLDLVYKHPKKYFIKGLSSKGINVSYLDSYKEMVGFNETNVKGLQSSYISIYGNFLRFYRGLDDYSKKTKNLSKEGIGVRQAIAHAKDPESALFSQIPEALGYFGELSRKDNSVEFITSLKQAIREIRTAYDLLIESIEQEISSHLNIKAESFELLKSAIFDRFGTINKNRILKPQLKLLLTRLTSPLDVKKAYWESICDAVLGKKLDKCTDDDIPVFIDNLKALLDDLNNLIDLNKLQGSSTGNAYQISILNGDASDKINENIFVNQAEEKAIQTLSKQIQSLLDKDQKNVSKAALIDALKKIIAK